MAAGQHPELGQGAVLQPRRPGALRAHARRPGPARGSRRDAGLPRVRHRQRRDRRRLTAPGNQEPS
ncbi:hypothetical protein G5V59_06170 [Nocardioides sp. W3-2-3]|uniref:hypothetical protein n=1 Tax=Nocardioides convexus TaxID=2712224 RepID=UPI00241854B3|nr:hypothetical protein [Nocardioides convexus]NGZ99963.1 hypothetical protein [Nocardioides convexus]